MWISHGLSAPRNIKAKAACNSPCNPTLALATDAAQDLKKAQSLGFGLDSGIELVTVDVTKESQ
jgi:hypothetical protein